MIYDLKRTEPYNKMKELTKNQSTQTLKTSYKILVDSELNTEQILALTVITSELENRGVLQFNEEKFDYEFIGE